MISMLLGWLAEKNVPPISHIFAGSGVVYLIYVVFEPHKSLSVVLEKRWCVFFCRKLSLGSRKKRPKKNGRDRKNGVFNDRVHDRKNLIS